MNYHVKSIEEAKRLAKYNIRFYWWKKGASHEKTNGVLYDDWKEEWCLNWKTYNRAHSLYVVNISYHEIIRILSNEI